MKKINILLVLLSMTFASCDRNGERSTKRTTDTDTVEQVERDQQPTGDITTERDMKDDHVEVTTPQTFTIERGSAGRVRLGMATNDLRKIFPAGDIRGTAESNGTIPSPVTEIIRNGHVSLRIESECSGNNCTVNRIKIFDAAYKTNTGIGIGSTLGDLRQHHNVDRVIIGSGELHAKVDALQAAFELDRTAFQIDISRLPDINTLPDAMTIKGVLIE